MSENEPVISVVIPAYNCEDYIRPCIDSLVAQTFDAFEIIVVDDGSTDATPEILESYSGQHPYIHVLHQQNKYAGVARNLGMQHARGSYIMFLDSDDYFEPTLLEEAYTRISETDADICVYSANWLNDATQVVKPMRHVCIASLCPDAETFNRTTNPEGIFVFTSPAPWTKLFKRSFIDAHGLTFQDTRSANDLRFVLSALALAERITLLDKPLVTYRRQNKSSLQGSLSKNPYDFYQALLGLRDNLKSLGLFDEMEQSFINTAVEICMYNLRSLSYDRAVQREVFDFLHHEALDELGIAGKPDSYLQYYPKPRLKDLHFVQAYDFAGYVSYITPTPKKRSLWRRALRKAKRVAKRVFTKR